ncbi:unnamed protein product [Paramecium pentaurelia]|uniref:Uncharacterized protein n=1 Tax=Paramecium pentaurelia TaxID=43138 RepID=A0A8S1T579_9CILI|nr:unnamed protein product [Paramecium pentaurelia]
MNYFPPSQKNIDTKDLDRIQQDENPTQNIVNQNQFRVQFSNCQEIQDIGESIVFQQSQFLKMINELNKNGDVIKLDMKAEEFNNIFAFMIQVKDILKGQEHQININIENIKTSEQFKDLFKDMSEKQVLPLLSLAEYLDIPNLIILLAAQYSSLIKDQPASINNWNY